MSQPIEHSPGPWHKDWVTGTLVIYDSNGDDVAKFTAGGQPLNVDMSLMLAAPTMYHILRVIIEDKQRPHGLIEAAAMSQAHRLMRELESGPDAEG